MLHFAWFMMSILLCSAAVFTGEPEPQCYYPGSVEPDDCHQAILRLVLPAVHMFEVDGIIHPPGIGYRYNDCYVTLEVSHASVEISPKTFTSFVSDLYKECALLQRASGNLRLSDNAVLRIFSFVHRSKEMDSYKRKKSLFKGSRHL
jgi:hypothetical protein